VCHGADARGDGPTSTWLIRKPADLTQLAAGNGGTFPTLRILTRIDGRDPFLDRRVAMPVYGNVLGGPLVPMTIETGQEVTVPEDLAAVVAWLQGVQE